MNERDIAAAYVLGALEPDEARLFEERLAQSRELQHEVAELREVSGLLAYAAPPIPRDDEALERRLLDRARGTATRRRAAAPMRIALAGLAAAVVLGIVAGVQWSRTQRLSAELTGMRAVADSLGRRLAARDATLDDILAPSTSLILLTSTGERPPGIQLFWNRAGRRVVLHAFNLPPASAGRAYQLWFLAGGAPVPGGTFNSDPDGRALVTLAGPPEGMALAAAAVTIEPAAGSAQPTTPIVVSGSVDPR